MLKDSHANGGPRVRGSVPTLEELRDWSICYVDVGQGFVGVLQKDLDGKPIQGTDGSCLLDPCYLMMGGYALGPQGVQRSRAIVPVELLVDETAFPVKPCMVIHLRHLSQGDFESLAVPMRQGIEQAEDLRRQMRAQRSGISLVPANAKLPPFPGLKDR